MEARDPPRDAEASAILKALQRGEPRAAASRLLIHRRVLDDVARFLVDERLGVYAFATTQSLALGALWPAPALERLRDQWQRQQQRNATLQGALAEIDSAFGRAGLEYLLLKGLPMAARFHGGVGHRFTWDLDLLVREPDVARACRVLRDLGVRAPAFTIVARRLAMRVAHALECTREDGLSVDLHWAFRRLPGLRFPSGEVFRESRFQELDGQRYPVPSDEHLLVQVLLGIAADVDRGLCRARALWDAGLLLRATPDRDWTGFLERRGHEGCRGPVVNALALAVHGTFSADEFGPLLQELGRGGDGLRPIGPERVATILQRAPHSLRNHLEFASWQDQPAWRYWSWWGATLPARAYFARRL